MVLDLKLELSMVCKDGRKKLLLFLLFAVTTQYVSPSPSPRIRYLSFFVIFLPSSDSMQRDVGFLKEKKRMNGMCWASVSLMSANYSYSFLYSGYDTSKTASCEFVFFLGRLLYFLFRLLIATRNIFQCVVGDSSTVCHGSKYLKKWIAWLDANADVKYAGLEWRHWHKFSLPSA